MTEETIALPPDDSFEQIVFALRKLCLRLPKPLRFRFQNALTHSDKSLELIEIDREMASFRGITAEEEAATALMRCLKLRRYEHHKEFNPWDHRHKVAILACIVAISGTMKDALSEFQLVFDCDKPRIDIKIPLSNFGVKGGEKYAVQLIEPLDIVHSRNGESGGDVYSYALNSLAEKGNFDNIKKMIEYQANARNTLLYASDSRLPKSEATKEVLLNRRKRMVAILVVTTMIWQRREHQALVKQAVLSFLSVMNRLPAT